MWLAPRAVKADPAAASGDLPLSFDVELDGIVAGISLGAPAASGVGMLGGLTVPSVCLVWAMQ